MSFYKHLQEYSAKLDRAWRKVDYESVCFSDLAAEILAKTPFENDYSPDEILKFLIHEEASSPMKIFHSADGVQTLYSTARFNITYHLWFDDFAIPHDHDWSGAVKVIDGQALSGTYKFDLEDNLNDYFKLGRLTTEGVEIHERGRCYAIFPGTKFLHSISYFSKTGAAISVRAKAPGAVSMNYLYPGIGYNSGFLIGKGMLDRFRALRALHSKDQGQIEFEFEKIFEQQGLMSSFCLLKLAFYYGWDVGEDLKSKFVERFGKRGEFVSLGFDEMAKEKMISDLRVETADPEIRFFLSALLLCHDRKTLLGLVKKSFPGCDPRDKIGAWLTDCVVDVEDQDGEGIPRVVKSGLGELIEGTGTNEILMKAKERFPRDKGIEDHVAFLTKAFSEIKKAPVYSSFFR